MTATLDRNSARPGAAIPAGMTPGYVALVRVPSGTQPQSVTVTASVTQVFALAGTGRPGLNMVIVNGGPAAIYAGGPFVTPQAGYMIPPGGRLLLEGPAVNAWAVTGAGTATAISWLTTLMTVT